MDISRVVRASAWVARDNACVRDGGTRVGCAIHTSDGCVYQGWNVEGPWHSSIHAEVYAVLQLAGKGKKVTDIAIVADVERFTPCGGCLDWLMLFCSPSTVLHVANKCGVVHMELGELYPLYPKR